MTRQYFFKLLSLTPKSEVAKREWHVLMNWWLVRHWGKEVTLNGIHAEAFPNSKMLLQNHGHLPNLQTSPTRDTEHFKNTRLVHHWNTSHVVDLGILLSTYQPPGWSALPEKEQQGLPVSEGKHQPQWKALEDLTSFTQEKQNISVSYLRIFVFLLIGSIWLPLANKNTRRSETC